MISLSDWLDIPVGITAVVGGGGKTSLIHTLAEELAERGRVLITTTTRIRPPACLTLLSPDEGQIANAFQHTRILAVGTTAQEGKLAEVAELRERYAALADFVLIEADGSRGLPLKTPASYEPVLPKQAALVIAVAGMTCAGQTVEAAAHRPALYAMLAQCHMEDVVQPEWVARVLEHPLGQRKDVTGRFAVVLNQADSPARLAFARKVARCLTSKTAIVALQSIPGWMASPEDEAGGVSGL